MKNRLFFAILCIFILVGSSAYTQKVYNLNLDESIAIAKLQSYRMLGLKQDLKISEYNLKSVTSGFKTRLYMDLDVPDYSESIIPFTDSTGTYFFSKRTSTVGGTVTLNQPLPTDGNIYLRSGINSTTNFRDRNRWVNLNTRLQLTQPINALYYNEIKSNLKIATLDYEQTLSRLKREELNLVYAVNNAFFELLLDQKRESIAKLNLERANEANQIAKNKYDAGLIREVEALQTEVDLAKAQNDYDLSIINQSASLNDFKELIGIALEDEVKLISSMEYDEIIVDPNKAVELALANRLELQESNLNIERDKLNVKRQRSAGMISGDINAYYDVIGVDGSPMETDLGTSFNNSITDLQNRPGNFGVGLSIHIPIIDWGRNKARVKSLEARLQQDIYEKEDTRRQIQSEILSLVANLNSSLKRLKLLEKNIVVAEKSFEITRLRFSDGDIDSQALALENERLNNAYQSHLSAYIAYKLMLADIMRKTFYDFVNDRPLVD